MVFLGTPAAAVVVLRALVAAGHDIALVVSRADARRGRGGVTASSPVKQAAVDLGLRVSDRVADVVGTGAELGIVVAYGRLVRPEVLQEVPMVNLHFSLLPRWRGAAPVERAILAGDKETGVCLMGLEEGLDTGPVYRGVVEPISDDDTAETLRARLAESGASMIVAALRDGLGEPRPQAGEVTYAAKLDPAELQLDWSSPAAALARVVRVGRAWTTWRGRRLLVLEAAAVPAPAAPPSPAPAAPAAPAAPHPAPAAPPPAALAAPPGNLDGDVVVTGAGGLRLRVVQPEGRRPLTGTEWVRGARPSHGELLGG